MKINEIFQSLQGEASLTGTPSIFVRTQYCPVGCSWCDTKHTWEVHKDAKISVPDMLNKTVDNAKWAEMNGKELAELLAEHFTAKHVVITGGEPFESEDLPEIMDELFWHGFSVQIETSGTVFRMDLPNPFHLTVSPKIGMPGGKEFKPEILEYCDELKYPVGKLDDVDTLIKLVNETNYNGLVYLQPLSQSKKATDLCIEMAARFGWRVSIQTHKFLGLR